MAMDFQHQLELDESLDSWPAWLRNLNPETGAWKSLQLDANVDEHSDIASPFIPIFDFPGNSAHIHDEDRFEVLPDSLADSSTHFSPDDAMPASSQLALSQTTNTQSNIVKPQPRWKRHNRKPIEIGNNNAGRGGKLRCGQCRHRKIKCVYQLENDICQFCMSRGFTDCQKLKGPKTEVRAVLPSRPITMYDPSIDERDLQTLRDFYRYPPCPYIAIIIIQLLGGTLFSCYGRTISHTGLRHAVLANFYSVLEGPSESSLLHVAKATTALRQKLSSNANVDDADLYVSFLLAIWHFHNDDEVSTIRIHLKGVENLMLHLLSETRETPLRLLWPWVGAWTMLRRVSGGIHEEDAILAFRLHNSVSPAFNRISGRADYQKADDHLKATNTPALYSLIAGGVVVCLMVKSVGFRAGIRLQH